MNEIQTIDFDYCQLDQKTSSFLQQKELNMREIAGKAYTQLGKELWEAKQELKKQGSKDGIFMEWYQSLGFNHMQVSRLIQRFELLTNCEEPKKSLIEELPLSLSYEVSKPTVNEELKQQVLDGEIKTLKEYNQLKNKLEEEKKKLKEAENLLKQQELEAKKAIEDKNKMAQLLKETQQRKPKVVEKQIIKEVFVEVVPQKIKDQLKEKDRWLSVMKKETEKLEEEIKGLKLQSQKENENNEDEELKEKKIKRLEKEANIETLQIVLNINKFIKESSLSAYQFGAIATANESTKKRIEESVKILKEFTKNLESALNGRIQI